MNPTRYPDPDLIAHDERFNKYKLGNTPIQRLYTHPDMLWAEGPAWNGVGKYLIWSDILNNVQMRRLNDDGHASTFRHPSRNSNGNTFDWKDDKSPEHGNRRVVRYEYDGTSPSSPTSSAARNSTLPTTQSSTPAATLCHRTQAGSP